MATEQDKQVVLANIESLWEDAAAASPDPSLLNTAANDTPSAPDKSEQIMSRISQLMYEAEEIQLAANDHVELTDEQIIADLAESISLDAETDRDNDRDNDGGIDEIGSMVMEAASQASSSETGSYEEIRSKLEDVSQLRPPQTDNRIPDNPEYAFGVAFSNLVRHVVRQYIETDFEPALRHAIKSEIENHLGRAAEKMTTDADGGNG